MFSLIIIIIIVELSFKPAYFSNLIHLPVNSDQDPPVCLLPVTSSLSVIPLSAKGHVKKKQLTGWEDDVCLSI